MRLIERDPRALADLGQAPAALAALKLARPDQRVDPLDPFPEARRRLRDRDARRAISLDSILRSYSAL